MVEIRSEFLKECEYEGSWMCKSASTSLDVVETTIMVVVGNVRVD